jgi:hypothetical protein
MISVRNVSTIGRFYRAIFGEILLLAAFFWVAGLVRVIAYVFSLILIFNALTGFCLVYKIFDISTYIKTKEEEYQTKKKLLVIIVIVFIIAGAIASYFVTKNQFLNDFNRINKDYKKLLVSTSQNNRADSIANYEYLAADYESFYEKYSSYKPYVIRKDKSFGADIKKIKEIIEESKHKIYYGNITSGYIALGSIRPVINDIRRRNKLEGDKAAFSDFYGSMEILIDAAKAGDIQEIERAYPLANEKLKYIESFMNTSEVQSIRINLDNIYTLAKKRELEKLSLRAAELESSYLNAYLKTG